MAPKRTGGGARRIRLPYAVAAIVLLFAAPPPDAALAARLLRTGRSSPRVATRGAECTTIVAMKILIVDDEPAISDTLAYALQTDGFASECCTLGADALARLDAGGHDLVVLDVGLPDMSGFDVCRALRRRSQVPVIFLTARSDEVDRIVGLELGADDYVAKPFSPRGGFPRPRHPAPRSAGVAGGQAPQITAVGAFYGRWRWLAHCLPRRLAQISRVTSTSCWRCC
jgi:CheY-like chemotaxis protein